MATKITLDSIREAAEVKFGSTEIELGAGNVVRLLSPIRMGEAQRAALVAASDSGEPEVGEDGEPVERETTMAETVQRFQDILRAGVSDWTPGGESPSAKALLSALALPNGEPDVATLLVVVEGYLKDQQVGEA